MSTVGSAYIATKTTPKRFQQIYNKSKLSGDNSMRPHVILL